MPSRVIFFSPPSFGFLFNMELKPWTLLFAGAFGCSIICLGLVYLITVTGNVSYESFIFVLMFLGVGLAGGGYYLESKYKKEHPDEYEFEDPVEE